LNINSVATNETPTQFYIKLTLINNKRTGIKDCS